LKSTLDNVKMYITNPLTKSTHRPVYFVLEIYLLQKFQIKMASNSVIA